MMKPVKSLVTRRLHTHGLLSFVATLGLLIGAAEPGTAAQKGSSATTLVDAVRARNTTVARVLLRKVDVNAAEPDGTTALHWAAHHGDLDIVDALIQKGANANAVNRYGITPLWLAAENGNTDVVAALLRAGADPLATRYDSGETALMIAAKGGYIPVLQQLLTFGADPNAVDAVRHQTALMWAAGEGHSDVVRLLVAAGASLESRSSSGLTPLMFAVRRGDIAGTLALIDLGADLRATASDGTTMLVLAIINGHWELAERLLERGADANGDDPRGRPLHVLTWMRRADNRGLSAWLPRRPTGIRTTLDLAKALLARGAQINDRINYKNSSYIPSHIALTFITPTSFNGATPLYLASRNCDVEFVRFLAANGADPSLPTSQGITPLLAAAGIGYVIGENPGTPEEALETVKLLQELGNDVAAIADFGGDTSGFRAGGWNGASALHGAVIRGGRELLEYLIAQGVPLDHKKRSGEMAVDLARGSELGVNYQVKGELAEILEKAMRAKGMPIPEHRYQGALPKRSEP
jgi:uncharacterized protein